MGKAGFKIFETNMPTNIIILEEWRDLCAVTFIAMVFLSYEWYHHMQASFSVLILYLSYGMLSMELKQRCSTFFFDLITKSISRLLLEREICHSIRHWLFEMSLNVAIQVSLSSSQRDLRGPMQNEMKCASDIGNRKKQSLIAIMDENDIKTTLLPLTPEDDERRSRSSGDERAQN
ncbi:hypothetical protein DICVIV_07623 [Dictyocaulus viviparus]|uniref:Uncharacterized protein n=1 Tax=Dictyocaulus viviparus TaxID=29172 RepID=A0A0D8XNW1_DICVI|nr:hypothetical protein DICVIV_07623 [Dictyocaulus viviparus]